MRQTGTVAAASESDGGTETANGWSLPATLRPASDTASGRQRASVPIPVYCRPVTDDPSVQVTRFCSVDIL